ncbi:MAG TPA: TadE/TadG family type IV pilus assembly protein [Pyrinomonadaceae bacterium]|nr:TadE/TadG family type IV pilus assembly protein [Pyrinomonadaceae bacterium]
MRVRTLKLEALRRFARSERGTQLVELAIVLPVLLLLLVITAEFGRFFYTYTTLAKATRAGARYLSTAPGNGSMDGPAKNLVVYGNTEGEGDPLVAGLDPTHVIISREGGNLTAGMPETVTVKIEGYDYQPIFDLAGMSGKGDYSLAVDVSPSTTMRFLLTIPS